MGGVSKQGAQMSIARMVRKTLRLLLVYHVSCWSAQLQDKNRPAGSDSLHKMHFEPNGELLWRRWKKVSYDSQMFRAFWEPTIYSEKYQAENWFFIEEDIHRIVRILHVTMLQHVLAGAEALYYYHYRDYYYPRRLF